MKIGLRLRNDMNIIPMLPFLTARGTCMLSQDGYTPLIRAAWKGNTDCVRLLLEAGADKDTVDAVRIMIESYLLECGGFVLYAIAHYLNPFFRPVHVFDL